MPLVVPPPTISKAVMPAGVTGNASISAQAGMVNFGAGQDTLVVTNSRVTPNSIIMPNVASNDSSMLSVRAFPASGSFSLIANAPADTETRVSFTISVY